MADSKDFTDKYNTQLSSADEAAFQQWANETGKIKDLYDYDIRGAWKQGMTEGGLPGDHLPDTYKKPNHPTFSDESLYHGQDGYQGGTWSTSMGRDVFTPGPTNLYSRDELKQYMGVADPDVILTAPPESNLAPSRKSPPGSNLAAPTILTSPGKSPPESNLAPSRKSPPESIWRTPARF